MTKPIQFPITEVFGPTIQGEGPVVGKRTVFIRFAGCDYQCVWCDSKHTWQAPIVKEMWSVDKIVEWLNTKKAQSGVNTVTLSGGNPALYDLTPLLDQLPDWFVSVETQGSFAPSWLHRADWLVVSPKPPSSNMETDFLRLDSTLRAGRPRNTFLKVVIFADQDYDYAQHINERWPQYPMYLSVGTFAPERQHEGQSIVPVGLEEREPVRDSASFMLDRMTALAERVMQDRKWKTDPFVLPQVHVLMWGHKRGV